MVNSLIKDLKRVNQTVPGAGHFRRKESLERHHHRRLIYSNMKQSRSEQGVNLLWSSDLIELI